MANTEPVRMPESGGGRRVLRLDATMAKVGLSKPAIYAKMAKGEFPKPIPLTVKARGWLEDELDAWLSDRIAQRDGEAA